MTQNGKTSILYTIPNFVTAGSGDLLYNIIQNLDRDRFSPTVCVSRGGGGLAKKLQDQGVGVLVEDFTVSGRPYHTLMSRVRRAAERFSAQGFDLWHSFHYLDDYTEPLIARRSGARAWVYTKKNMSWNGRSWFLRSRLADGIAAQNRDMIDRFFSSRLLRGRARYVPSGVDVDRFRPPTEADSQNGVTVVACVAHLLPVKGHETLIRAVADCPQVQLRIAGREDDERYAAVLKRLVGELQVSSRVEFLGEIDSVLDLLHSSDVFVLPSRAQGRMEGCPVALLEAMACGLACVSTDIPGCRDVIEDGDSGVLVDPDSHESLASALQRLSVAPEDRRRMGEAARARAENEFSTRHEARRYQDLYRDVLEL